MAVVSAHRMCFEMKEDLKGARQVKCSGDDLKFKLEDAKNNTKNSTQGNKGDDQKMSKEELDKMSKQHCTFTDAATKMNTTYRWNEGRCERNITFVGTQCTDAKKQCSCAKGDFNATVMTKAMGCTQGTPSN